MKTENGTYPSAAEQFYSMVMLAILIISGLLIKMALSRQNRCWAWETCGCDAEASCKATCAAFSEHMGSAALARWPGHSNAASAETAMSKPV